MPPIPRPFLTPCLRNGFSGYNVHTLAALIELDFAIHEGKKSEIGADSDTLSGMKLRSHLPNKNVPSPNGFATVLFDSTPLSVGIPTVTAGPLTLFMRHCFLKIARAT